LKFCQYIWYEKKTLTDGTDIADEVYNVFGSSVKVRCRIIDIRRCSITKAIVAKRITRDVIQCGGMLDAWNRLKLQS